MGWEERVWGYSGAGGLIQAFATGYFCVGFGNLCGECGDFWGRDVGACRFGVDCFRPGVCESSLCLPFSLLPDLKSRGSFRL